MNLHPNLTVELLIRCSWRAMKGRMNLHPNLTVELLVRCSWRAMKGRMQFTPQPDSRTTSSR